MLSILPLIYLLNFMNRKKYYYILLPIIVFLIIIILDYFSIIGIGIFTGTYKGKIGDSYYTFRYSKNLKVNNYETHLLISKPEYFEKKNKPILAIYFYDNNFEKKFGYIKKWHSNFINNENEKIIKSFIWLDNEAIKTSLEYKGIGSEESDYFTGEINYYTFFQNKDYVLEISDRSKSIYPYELENEFNAIIDSFKIY